MVINTNEFYTGGTYFKNNPTWDSEDAKLKSALINQIISNNNLHPIDMVEIGCGAGGNLVELSKLNQSIQSFKGYDISPQAIAMAKPFENDQLHFYCEDYFLINNTNSQFLLMIDVIEHIEDYYGFLQKLKSRSTYFVFHIPLDLSCRTILKPHVLLQQREAVGHLHYFSKEIIEWALLDAGYEILDQFYTKPVVDIEPAKTVKRFLKKTLRNFSYTIAPDWSVKKWGGYSIMFLLK